MKETETGHLERLNLDIPKFVRGLDPWILKPRDTWHDKAVYDRNEQTLIRLFRENFKKFNAEP